MNSGDHVVYFLTNQIDWIKARLHTSIVFRALATAAFFSSPVCLGPLPIPLGYSLFKQQRVVGLEFNGQWSLSYCLTMKVRQTQTDLEPVRVVNCLFKTQIPYELSSSLILINMNSNLIVDIPIFILPNNSRVDDLLSGWRTSWWSPCFHFIIFTHFKPKFTGSYDVIISSCTKLAFIGIDQSVGNVYSQKYESNKSIIFDKMCLGRIQ